MTFAPAPSPPTSNGRHHANGGVGDEDHAFDERVRSFLENLEETRQAARRFAPRDDDDDDVDASPWSPTSLLVARVDRAVGEAEGLASFPRRDDDDARAAVVADCGRRAYALCLRAAAATTNDPPTTTNDVVPDEDQAAVARVAELTLRCRARWWTEDDDEEDTRKETDRVIAAYASYQRRVLRARARPAVARLVEWRRAGGGLGGSEEEEDEDEDEEDPPPPPHTGAIMTVLGEASSLLQPLGAWRSSLGSEGGGVAEDSLRRLCDVAANTLHREARGLAATVVSWTEEDADRDGDDGSDAVVDELAALCRLLSRYDRFVESLPAALDPSYDDDGGALDPARRGGRYAAAEDRAVAAALRRARETAAAVPLVTGGRSYAPSAVEDALYVSRRALDRARSTGDADAACVVAHRVEETWRADDDANGVRAALRDGDATRVLEEEERDDDDDDDDEPRRGRGSYGLFAVALLDAIDHDVGQKDPSVAADGVRPPAKTKRLPIARDPVRARLLSRLCLLNGLAGAAAACAALSASLQELAEEHRGSPSHERLLLLSRDNLASHAADHARETTAEAERVVRDLCGPSSDDLSTESRPLDPLRRRIAECDYRVANADELAEREALVEDEIGRPVREGSLLAREGLRGGRCETTVAVELVKALAAAVVEDVFLRALLRATDQRRPFTDWGGLLLSTQFRALQNALLSLLPPDANPAPVLARCGRLARAVAVLGLERPSDWTDLRYDDDDDATTATDRLTKEEIRTLMSLRVDFAEDAVRRACS